MLKIYYKIYSIKYIVSSKIALLYNSHIFLVILNIQTKTSLIKSQYLRLLNNNNNVYLGILLYKNQIKKLLIFIKLIIIYT